MKRFLLIIFTVLSMSCMGQFYPLEAGGFGGYSSGFTFRAYLDDVTSYEALVSFKNRGLQLHLFRQENKELQMTELGSVYLTFGYGAHAGFYYADHYNIFFRDVYFGSEKFSPLAGVDMYAAFEYRFQEIPLSVGIAYKPYMELSLRQIFGINIWDVGFTVKYRFKAQNEYY